MLSNSFMLPGLQLTLQYPSPLLSKTFLAILLSELRLFLSPSPVCTFLLCTLLLGVTAAPDGELADPCDFEEVVGTKATARREARIDVAKAEYLMPQP